MKVESRRMKNGAGFTLIELLVVFSVAAILGGIGIAGFSSYNDSQILTQTTNDVVSMLQTAKSRAQSQYKPAGCTDTLLYYKVTISSPTYTLTAVCGSTNLDLSSKTLPGGMTFSISRSVNFYPLLGGAYSSGSIVLNKGSVSKTITVSGNGNITTSP